MASLVNKTSLIYSTDMVSRLMDDLQLIAEEDIGYAMAYMMDKHHIITEGAATVMTNEINHQEGELVVLITGQNVDTAILYALIQKYITQEEK